MNSKDIRGLTVISLADGTQIGTIDQVYLDLAAKQVVVVLHNERGRPLRRRARQRANGRRIRRSTRWGQTHSRSTMSRRRMPPGSARTMGR